MFWIGIEMALVAGMAVAVVTIVARRPADIDELGCVSAHWIAHHRVDSS